LTAAQQLQQLAGSGYQTAYKATYAVRQRKPAGQATWVVWHTKDIDLRVDVLTGHVTTTLINTARATFACRKTPHHRACFQVAQGGKGPFTLLAEKLFSADLNALRKSPRGFSVSAASPQSGDTCFAIASHSKSSKALASATYCFNSNGILAAVTYPNGNSVRLQHLDNNAPPKQTYRPYSSPTPVAG
jgi:hypothetical protein